VYLDVSHLSDIIHPEIKDCFVFDWISEADYLLFYSQPGTKVMILPHVKDEELPKLFPKGVDKVSMPSGISYVRTTTDY
jgi:hypothetical protein